jgi:hypothetical protein
MKDSKFLVTDVTSLLFSSLLFSSPFPQSRNAQKRFHKTKNVTASCVSWHCWLLLCVGGGFGYVEKEIKIRNELFAFWILDWRRINFVFLVVTTFNLY